MSLAMDDMDFNTISEPVAAHESELLAMTEAPTAIASTAADASGGEAATGVDAMMGDAATGDASKTKRQLLSCTSCRKRKVKCDRVYPCQACCGRGHPKECVFLTKEKEDYEPIAQSYEIRKLRLENERLRARLRGKRAVVGVDRDGSSSEGRDPPRVPDKPTKLQQRRFKTNDQKDHLYFGSPGLANVIADFANMHMSAKLPTSVTHTIPKGEDVYAFQDISAYPFGTFWRADGLGHAPVHCLPPREEIFAYLDAFQKRAQSCSFPHTPEEITRKEIERFLSKTHENAVKHPAMLALIFAALAQGLQNGVYDKSGGQWVAGAMEAEAWKGDMYIAAAMQCLRMASFLNRPTLLCIQTLIMIGPYLTNGGRFLDAWALFGITVRLAHSIGLHRNPKYLDPAPPLRECSTRQALWWWMLHMDQQYSMTLGRPLGISGIGDCPPPEPLTTNPTILRLSEYINAFTILARQILSSDRLTTQKIDEYTDKLLALRDTLPRIIQFDSSWNDAQKPIPDWPLDAQAAVFHGKTHNFLILLNRQRQEADETPLRSSNNNNNTPRRASSSSSPSNAAPAGPPLRGRDRVLSSARALLSAFEFFHSRVCAAMVCWTMGQQAFNASMILALNLLRPSPSTTPAQAEATRDDYLLVQDAWVTFREMDQKGIHKLAGVASSKIYALLSQIQPGVPHPQTTQTAGPSQMHHQQGGIDGGMMMEDAVMGNTGMLLLEDPGLQAFVPEPFEPLGFQMAGADLPAHGLGRYSTNVSQRMDLNMPMGIGADVPQQAPGWAARPVPAPMATREYPSTGFELGSTPTPAVGEPATGMGGGYAGQHQWSAGPNHPSGPSMPLDTRMGLGTDFGVETAMGGGAQGFNSQADASGSRRRSGERPAVAPKPAVLRVSSTF